MGQVEIASAFGSQTVFNAESNSGLDISIDAWLGLIQVLRLAQALVEAGCHLHVRPADAPKLVQLAKIFGMRYVVGTEGAQVLPGVVVDHMSPETRIGSITRPLVFPFATFEYCRVRWPQSRGVRASFAGLLTPSRTSTINEWLKLSGLRIRVPGSATRVKHRIARRFGIALKKEIRSDGVKLAFSDEGRVFPRKAWNVDYFAGLLESEFVLCPDGDFGKNGVAWTYRFFESVLCGAIPVVQNTCSIYEGFRFRYMDEPLSRLRWSRDDAEHNFNLALERLTIPPDELRAEVRRLLARNDRQQASPVA